MSRSFESVSADFDALAAGDFEDSGREPENIDRVNGLCDELLAIGDAAACAPVLIRTLERLGDGFVGSPGPLVHALESGHAYESLLAESVRRKPTRYTVWMVNRILNAGPDDPDLWLDLLRNAAQHPDASMETKIAVADYLEFQLGA